MPILVEGKNIIERKRTMYRRNVVVPVEIIFLFYFVLLLLYDCVYEPSYGCVCSKCVRACVC